MAIRRTITRHKYNPNRVNQYWEAADVAVRDRYLAKAAAAAGPNMFGGAGGAGLVAAKRLLLQDAIEAGQQVAERWAGLFGGMDRFNDARCSVMLRLLLDEGCKRDDLMWAAEAYWRFVDDSEWHRKQAEQGVNAVQSFERFYQSDRLDQWLAAGRKLARSGERRRDAREAVAASKAAEQAREARRAELMARFRGLLAAQQEALLSQAAASLRARTGYGLANPTIRNELVATEVFRLMTQGAW